MKHWTVKPMVEALSTRTQLVDTSEPRTQRACERSKRLGSGRLLRSLRSLRARLGSFYNVRRNRVHVLSGSPDAD